jgi:hypothetical protein
MFLFKFLLFRPTFDDVLWLFMVPCVVLLLQHTLEQWNHEQQDNIKGRTKQQNCLKKHNRVAEIIQYTHNIFAEPSQ